ncbi:MAG: glucosamine-6-phosphate deaminase [Planctomycetota bacterium]
MNFRVSIDIAPTAAEAAIRVSARIAEHISIAAMSPRPCRLGLATGSTPEPVYCDLAGRVARGELSMASVATFNLDEYVGLAKDHPQSYHTYMHRQLFDHVDIDLSQTHLPRGDAVDPEQEAKRYEQAIAAAGDMSCQLLGIGRNGHIGFNEPGSEPDSLTRVVQLTEDTIRANARFFDDIDDVPRQAITVGIGTILRSQHIILLATGESKASAVAAAIDGPVTKGHPASFLQTHPKVTFVLDRAAAGLLRD